MRSLFRRLPGNAKREGFAEGSMPSRQETRGVLAVKDQFRALCIAVSLGLAAAALYDVPVTGMPGQPRQWWLLLASFGCAIAALWGLSLTPAPPPAERRPADRARWWLGAALAAAGAVLWVVATQRFYMAWAAEFDRAWISWVVGTCLLAIGLDLAAGRWDAERRTPRGWWLWAAIAVTLVLAGTVRLGMIDVFPGPAGMTQIEDLQFGNWGQHFLDGERGRWEFIGHAWISALSIKLGGAQLFSMRVGYAIVGTLTVVAVFLWLRLAAGSLAAAVGTAFLVVSSWDAVVSRIGFNPNVLTVAVLYVLLLGPARRGRPSAYAFMGLLSGYLLWEYIAYRPAAAFALLGGAFYSLREQSAGWAMRLGRPALMLALICLMSVPLFGTRLNGRIMDEYMNPINRARGTKQYYNPDYDWRQVVEMRLARARDTVGLLFFVGDGSPARNIARRPLVDGASATLMLVGFAYCLANPRLQLFGLFAVAFVVTTVGAMIITGELNTLRMSVTIPYLYFFAGLAGAAIHLLWRRAWGRIGGALAILLLLVGIGWASYSNLGFLHRYWTSPGTRAAARSNLALLASWLGQNVRPGEQVVGAGGRSSEALGPSDAAWLRGDPIPGVMEWDILTALHGWKERGPTVVVLFVGQDTQDHARFLRDLIPGLEMEFIPDELAVGGELAFGRLPDRPASLDAALDGLRCRGINVEYIYRGENPNEILHRFQRVEPMIGLGTWPTAVVHAFHRGVRPKRLEVHYDAVFRIETAGQYRLDAKFYVGPVTLQIDERTVPSAGGLYLEAGEHRFHAVADLEPLAGGLTARFLWAGPDSGGEYELIPFYRIAEPVPPCTDLAAK